MKLQTGVRVEAELWRGYRVVCGRERLRPSRPIEEFLRFVVDGDSAFGLLNLMRGAAKARSDGFEAYARVLLDWYTHGKLWVSVLGDDAAVESLLLDTLKLVADSDLRRRIEEALVARQRGVYLKKKEAEKAEEQGGDKPKVIGETEKPEVSEDVSPEEANDQNVKEMR
jgi:hypothetical protein